MATGRSRQSRQSRRSTWLALIVGACAWLALKSIAAPQQWVWLDDRGNKVYSDVAPPSSVPDARVLVRPTAENETSSVKSPTPSAPATASSEVKSNAASPRGALLSASLPKLVIPTAVKPVPEPVSIATPDASADGALSEQCLKAKKNISALSANVRVAQVNAQGQREFMSEIAKAKEVSRLQAIIADECAPK